MKQNIRFSVLICTLLCFFIFCGDNGTNGSSSNTPDTRLSIVGDWGADLPVGTLGNFLINLSIKTADSSFLLSIVENDQINNYTLYTHSGTWRIGTSIFRGGDSLYLFGKECYSLDTTVNPATMRQLPDSIAKKTIALDTTRTEKDEWIINLGSLTPYMGAMVPQETMHLISVINLTFKRKEKIFIRY